MFNVLLGCTHNAHMRKREKLCNMTKKSIEILLGYCRRHPKNSVKTGTTGTHGAKGCPVSVTRSIPGRGCIWMPRTA
nr:MAG TPA: hypothetical protein [Caudoviricetes sp.]